MAQKPEKRALNRGLSALMSDVNLAAETSIPKAPDQNVPIEYLSPNPLQPRKDFDHAALHELANSIRQRGVIQPLIVRPAAAEGRYEIVAGERRWRAAQLAAVHLVPVIIRALSDQEVLEVAIIENIQRADLNPLEEAMAYKQLMDVHGHTQEMVAEALSKSRSHIANQLRLLGLPAEVQSMVRAGTLTAGHARALITSQDPLALAKTVVGKGLSVRETETLARSVKLPAHIQRPQRRIEKDADTRAIEADLSASVGMPVTIKHGPGDQRGQLTISYRNLEELDSLCQLLSLNHGSVLARQ
ncbi:MAG: ParB/RepB/Spo0J family partition protein [Rhodobacteraceae bacterium]|nr:ParB/RepB/Spo0J family partition protein [Paracoccaceae bacterium]